MFFKKSDAALKLSLGFILLIFTCLYWISKDFPFFWDVTQHISRKAHFFFQHGLEWIPVDIHEGHPPLVAMIHALCWTVIGKQLWVSHLITLVISYLIIYELFLLVKKEIDLSYQALSLLVLCTEPLLLTQSMIMGTEVWIFLGFLLCWNGVSNKQYRKLGIGTVLLAFTSLRGIIILGSFAVFHVFVWARAKKISVLRHYIPVGLILLIYFVLQYVEYGWLFISPSDRWQEGRQIQSFSGIIENGMIILFRIVENGKMFYWFILLMIVLSIPKNSRGVVFKNPLFTLAIISLIAHLPIWLISSNTIGLRYLMIPLFLFVVWLIKLLTKHLKKRTIQLAFGIMLYANILAHFIIYPKNISQSWDASLAHLPYYEARNGIISFAIDNEDKKIGSSFPLKGNMGMQDLKNYEINFVDDQIGDLDYSIQMPMFNMNQYIPYEECIDIKITNFERLKFRICSNNRE